MTRRFLVVLLARLDASPLPITDPVRLALEWEILCMLAALAPPEPPASAVIVAAQPRT